MRILTRSLLGILPVLALAGCLPSGEDELRVWMAEQRANTKPTVTPLTEPKKFVPESYLQGGGLSHSIR